MCFSIIDFAFPYDKDPPSGSKEGIVIIFVALLIRAEFITPEILSRRGLSSELAPAMGMPKATVNEYYRFELGKHKVWRSRKPFNVKTISETESMQNSSKAEFRPSVALPHTSHNA
jgi:hypothetical protein